MENEKPEVPLADLYVTGFLQWESVCLQKDTGTLDVTAFFIALNSQVNITRREIEQLRLSS